MKASSGRAFCSLSSCSNCVNLNKASRSLTERCRKRRTGLPVLLQLTAAVAAADCCGCHPVVQHTPRPSSHSSLSHTHPKSVTTLAASAAAQDSLVSAWAKASASLLVRPVGRSLLLTAPPHPGGPTLSAWLCPAHPSTTHRTSSLQPLWQDR